MIDLIGVINAHMVQSCRLQEMYSEILTHEFVQQRRKDIRRKEGRGHARAKVSPQVADL